MQCVSHLSIPPCQETQLNGACMPAFDVINGALEVSQHVLALLQIVLLDLLVLRLQAARQLLQLLCQQRLCLQLRLYCTRTCMSDHGTAWSSRPAHSLNKQPYVPISFDTTTVADVHRSLQPTLGIALHSGVMILAQRNHLSLQLSPLMELWRTSASVSASIQLGAPSMHEA